eukprot:2676116-Rhodomonas_salina.1
MKLAVEAKDVEAQDGVNDEDKEEQREHVADRRDRARERHQHVLFNTQHNPRVKSVLRKGQALSSNDVFSMRSQRHQHAHALTAPNSRALRPRANSTHLGAVECAESAERAEDAENARYTADIGVGSEEAKGDQRPGHDDDEEIEPVPAAHEVALQRLRRAAWCECWCARAL